METPLNDKPLLAQDKPNESKLPTWRKILNITENVFSLGMLSTFEYLSAMYIKGKYFDKSVDETTFWMIINHITPLFVARGLQMNACALWKNMKELCCGDSKSLAEKIESASEKANNYNDNQTEYNAQDLTQPSLV